MAREKNVESAEIEGKALFRKNLQEQVRFHCNCINHYVAGCDSPFGYLQIADVQEKLREIHEILGIEDEK